MIVARAPLRLSIGGGGTDLPSYYTKYGSFFISAAINKYIYVSVNRPASDELIKLKYSLSEEVRSPEELKHDLAREALISLGITTNIEIASMADVAAGTGLGSSGSYLVALLAALRAFKADPRPPQLLAEEAFEIETDRAKHSVGKQDQYAAAFGGINCFNVDPRGSVEVTPLRLTGDTYDELERRTMLFFTGATRSAPQMLEKQDHQLKAGVMEMVESLHRTKEIGRSIQDALEAGDLDRYGQLLDAHWTLKKQRNPSVTNERVEDAYSSAKRRGALGGKILGAGGGGFLMLLTTGGNPRQIREVVESHGLRFMPFRFDLDGAKVVLNA